MDHKIKFDNKPLIFKTVYLPILVPLSDYCWDGEIGCMHFNNYCSQLGVCDLDGMYPFYDKENNKYKKLKNCKDLSDAIKVFKVSKEETPTPIKGEF